LEELAS